MPLTNYVCIGFVKAQCGYEEQPNKQLRAFFDAVTASALYIVPFTTLGVPKPVIAPTFAPILPVMFETPVLPTAPLVERVQTSLSYQSLVPDHNLPLGEIIV